MTSERPNYFICEQVKHRWEHWYSAKTKLLNWLLFRDAIVFISVMERIGINIEPLKPDGELSGCWRYNAHGWEHIDVKNVRVGNEIDDSRMLVDYAYSEGCVYAIDKSKQIAVVSWTYLTPIHISAMVKSYNVTTEYRITETEGHVNFIVNRIEKSKPEWISCIRSH